MSVDKAIQLLQQALVELQAPPPPPPTNNIIPVTAGALLQSVHDSAPEGSTLQLEPGTYNGVLNSTKRLTWESNLILPPGRITPNLCPVTIISSGQTLTNKATDAIFRGMCFKSTDPQQTIVVDNGLRFVFEQCVSIGDPAKGQHRGFCPHGTDAIITDSFIDECWLVGRDAAAIGGWDGTNGLLVNNSYLGGGAQSILFGGADPANPSRTPQKIQIQKCILSKNPNWYTLGAQIKTALELKNAVDVTVQDTVMEYAGISGGSTGYVCLLTPRNQNNTAPFSSVQRVLLERCLMRFGGGAFNLLGQDDTNPSGPLMDITIRNVMASDLDPTGPWKGQGRIFLFNKGPQKVTIDGFTAAGKNLQAQFYFIKPPVGLTVRNAVLPVTKYGVKIDGGASGWDAVKATTFAPDTVVDLKPGDTGAVGYPIV